VARHKNKCGALKTQSDANMFVLGALFEHVFPEWMAEQTPPH